MKRQNALRLFYVILGLVFLAVFTRILWVNYFIGTRRGIDFTDISIYTFLEFLIVVLIAVIAIVIKLYISRDKKE